MEELRALGFSSAEPFEAMVDFCQVTVLKKRAKKSKERPGSQPPSSSVRTVRAGLPGLGKR